MKPITNQGYKLLHDGAIALSQVEANGIKIDTDYLRKAIRMTGRQIDQMLFKLKSDKIYRVWQKAYGTEINLASRTQLGKVLFEIMKYPCDARTATERPKTDEETLRKVNLKFITRYLNLEKLKKARNTYLKGILRETINGFCHPFFPLNLTQTYRGSSDHPNFQNIIKKNPELAKLIRRCFIARPNYRIVETDYGKVEVCGAACYHHDPRMIKYLNDPKKDLHRDVACKCYMLPKNQISWDARDTGKNMFVFPQFYGDYYISCAQHMWNAMADRKIKTMDGVLLRKHLRRKGIIRLGECNPKESPEDGTFEKHIQEIEWDFWNILFKVYNQWKKIWYEEYLKKGYFDLLTGFRIEGYFNRKQVINFPIQGTAFHWLLWALIRIIKLLRKYRMRSMIVGQIHDSIIGDVHKRELRDYSSIVTQVMTEDVPKHWKWIIVPLRVEIKASPVGGSWYDIKEIKTA